MRQQLHICHVLETAGGGSAQVVLDLVRYGLAEGDDVSVLYAPDRADERFVQVLTATGAKILTSPMQRKIGLRDLRDSWLLLNVLRRAGPFDIIHAHSSKAGALARTAGLLLPGTVIYTPHCFYSMTPSGSKKYALIERTLSLLAPSVIVVSQQELLHARAIGIAQEKLSLIPNGITASFPVTREEARKNLKADDGEFVIGFVGRLETQKNPVRALEAFAAIAAYHRTARLVMVGDGALRGDVEVKVAALQLTRRITLLGQKDARTVMPAFDCLLCSSDFEGLPLIFLEALAAGVPIVTTPVGGSDEAVIPGDTGYVAARSDAESLSSVLGDFLALTPEARRSMAENARRHSALFTVDIMGAKHRELYRRCAGA